MPPRRVCGILKAQREAADYGGLVFHAGCSSSRASLAIMAGRPEFPEAERASVIRPRDPATARSLVFGCSRESVNSILPAAFDGAACIRELRSQVAATATPI